MIDDLYWASFWIKQAKETLSKNIFTVHDRIEVLHSIEHVKDYIKDYSVESSVCTYCGRQMVKGFPHRQDTTSPTGCRVDPEEDEGN